MSTIRKGIESFLAARRDDSKYLIDRWSPALESQYLVHPGSVEVEEGSNVWTDGKEEWCNHRWPYKAGSTPYYKDKNLRFNPPVHLSRVGSTWWNWETKRSVAVAFDIDMEEGHAPSTTTVTEKQLGGVVARLKKLPYVTLLRSTGGKGVHVYVFFDEDDQPQADNHNEHTQVALSVLEKMKDDADYDFSQHMDVKGVVFWFWSDTSPAGHPGFDLIQEASDPIGDKDIQDYIGQSLKNSNASSKVVGYDDSGKRTETEGDYRVYELDDDHKSILKELETLGYSFIWNGEYNMAHTHTCALKELHKSREKKGKPLAGTFDTLSQGSDKTKPNCYITPRPNGVFQVKRFGNGIAEHPLWHKHDNSTWCYFNQNPDADHVFNSLCGSRPKDNKFVFSPDALKEAMESMGHSFGYDLHGAVEVVRRKDGTFVATAKEHVNGWAQDKDGNSTFLLPVISDPEVRGMSTLEEVDLVVRHLLTPQLEDYGYAVKTNKGWIMHTESVVNLKLRQKFGKETDFVREAVIDNPWEMVCIPFSSEYQDGRRWNKDAPQLAIQPSDVPGPHPHWDMVYDHIGSSLDDVVSTTPWCQQWGLQTGADYLRCWMASLIQYPFEPLPYLFLYGPQDSGKSIFHETASLLFTNGSVVSASGALTNSQGFNYEIAHCVIGFVEEKDLSVNRDGAYAKMKEWITGKTLTVTKKSETPYTQPNILKLVQMANTPKACPMEDGDTRITAFAVSALGDKKIPRGVMGRKLVTEAPFFLRTILSTHLPETPDRLRVPMLASKDKQDLESMNQTPWESFAADNLIRCPGNLIKFGDFYEAYQKFCTLNNESPESLKALLQLMRNRSDKYLIGLGPNKQQYIANVHLAGLPTNPSKPYELNKQKGRLMKCTT